MDKSLHNTDQVLNILRKTLDPSQFNLVKAAIDNAEIVDVIRDAFLEGRGYEAVALIKKLDPDAGVRKIQGISSANHISAGATAYVTARPQVPFLGRRFVVSPDIANSFLIDDIRVGNHTMFLSTGSIAADLFTPTAGVALPDDIERDWVRDPDGCYTIKVGRVLEESLGLPIDMPECQVSQDLIVVVTNISGVMRPFYAAFVGTTPHH